MLLARTYVNDTFPGATATPGEGQILTDTAPFTIPLINSSIRELYRKLGNSGTPTLIRDNFIVSGLDAVVTVNPSVQTSLTFAGYNNGTALNAALQLPADLLAVLRVFERQTGSGNPFIEMVNQPYGLQSRNQVIQLVNYEYRADGLYFVGSTVQTDVRLRYTCQLPGKVSGAGTDFASLSVPIQDSEDALAWLICKKYGFRLDGGDEEYAAAKDECDEAIKDLANRQTRAKQGARIEREPYQGGDCGGSGYGY